MSKYNFFQRGLLSFGVTFIQRTQGSDDSNEQHDDENTDGEESTSKVAYYENGSDESHISNSQEFSAI